MAQMIHRRDFNRTLEHLYDRSPGTVDIAALRNTMEAMAKAGERLRTRWENECSYEWANTPAYMAATERLALRRLRGEAEAARLLGRRASALLAEGRPAASASSMAKLSIALLARRTAELGTRLLGPEALVEGDGRVAALTRACAGSTVAGGAAEIQRRVIARQGLGCAA